MRLTFALVAAASSACGTYSYVRSADTMPAGRVELTGAIAASQLEANTVVHGAYAITDRLEVIGQNEIWNSFVGLRFGILHSERDGIGLAIGAGGGQAVTLVSAIGEEVKDGGDSGAAGVVEVAVGKRFGDVSLTLGHREFYMVPGFVAASSRLGVRWDLGDHFGLLLEGGATIHAPTSDPSLAIVIGEGTAGFWVGFGAPARHVR